MWIAALGGALVLAAAIVGIALAVADGGEDFLAAAGCTTADFPELGRQHVSQLKKDFEYNSTPPTSGPHHPIPAVWNVYDRPVAQFRLVHNLEHGGIVVQYGDDVRPETVARMVGWYRSDPNGMIVAPLPQLGADIALTAWTHLATCSSGFDENAFSQFRDDHRFKGPEAFPPESLAPGSV